MNRRKIEYRRSNRVSRVGETSKRQRSYQRVKEMGSEERERERERGGEREGTWHRASTVKLAQIEKG